MKRKLILLPLLGALLLPSAFASFDDVPQSRSDRAAIDYVTGNGLFSGTEENLFSPDAPLTRAQAVAVLARMAHAPGVPTDVFTDVRGDAYYTKDLGWAHQNGMVRGATDTTFEPDRTVTHKELAAMLTRYRAWLGLPEKGLALNGQDSNAPITRGEAAVYYATVDQDLMRRDAEVKTHTAADGVSLTGKLDLPAGDGAVDKLVLFVNGSGPNTYDNRRSEGTLDAKYFDLFAEQFGARRIGFFRYNTRGVSIGDQPPMYDSIDENVYRTYLPETSVSDIGEWIGVLRQEPRLKDAKIYLLGWSEGTIIAPLAAERFSDQISGLLLAGYCNDRLDEILEWQQSGESSMIFYRLYFDTDGDGAISEAEYKADPYGIVTSVLQNTDFSAIDLNQDGTITTADLAIMLEPGKKALYDAIERGDDEWLAQNYPVRLTSAWFQAHEKLAPNRETLPKLDLPITIFHGTADQNCDVAGVRAIEKSFADKGKTNLTVHIYEGYDHNLLYNIYPPTGRISQAFEDIFQTAVAQ